jgi:hypothetical protein
MSITITEVRSVQEVSFQSLFEGSFPDIDINYFVKNEEKGYTEGKRDLYLRNLQGTLEGQKIPGNQRVLAFKASIDGVDHLLNVGFVDPETMTFKSVWLLSKPHEGSRGFIHTPEYISLRKAFLEENGVKNYSLRALKDSVLYNSLKRSDSSGTITIKEEVPVDLEPHPGLELVDIVFSL